MSAPEPYVPPSSMEEYQQRVVVNTTASGFDLDIRVHMPCAFCAAPDWAVYPVFDSEREMARDRRCAVCGRSGRWLFTVEPEVSRSGKVVYARIGQLTAEFVQTGGPPPPVWLDPAPRYVPSDGTAS